MTTVAVCSCGEYSRRTDLSHSDAEASGPSSTPPQLRSHATAAATNRIGKSYPETKEPRAKRSPKLALAKRVHVRGRRCMSIWPC